jgi:hypothetical protein
MEFDADITGKGEPIPDVVHDSHETVDVDRRCPTPDIKRYEIGALEVGRVELDFVVYCFLETFEERFLVLDTVIGAVGTEVLAEGDVKIEPGVL